MPRLVPASFHFIPVHPGTEGYNIQRLAVEKHVFPSPKPAERRFAFLFSHSNGFHKESLHPVIRSFANLLRKQEKFDTTDFDIIAWDARNHGDSARLNEGTFSPKYTWFDNAMDTKQVVDEMGLKTNYDKLIGVGHSFGATSMLLCQHLYPKTFDAFCVTEPVLSKFVFDVEVRNQFPTMASARRRDTWPSRQECIESLRKRDFWRAFDPEVLQLYVDYGMYETPDGKIKLKCTKEQECHNFQTEFYASCTTFHALPLLTQPIHFIYALGSQFLSKEELPERKAHCGKNSTFVFLEGSHMVPNEHPEVVAKEINALVNRVVDEEKSQELPSKL